MTHLRLSHPSGASRKSEDTAHHSTSRVPIMTSSRNNLVTFPSYAILLLLCYLIVPTVRAFPESDVDFVDECRTECASRRDPFTCGKFRAVQWIHNFTSANDLGYGSFRLVRTPAVTGESLLPPIPRLQFFDRHARFLNFVRSSAEDVFKRRAVVYTLPRSSGARSWSLGPVIMDKDEIDEMMNEDAKREKRLLHKKKKKVLSVVLPMLILWKMFKMKLLLIPILISVHFIKKLLILGALGLSSLFSNLKYCKVQQPVMPAPAPMALPLPTFYHPWATAPDTSAVDLTGTGHEDDGWSHRADLTGYAAAAAAVQDAGLLHNPYRAYYQAVKQQQLLAQQQAQQQSAI